MGLDENASISAKQSSPEEHKNILLVDDDQLVLSLLETTLKKGGFDVVIASSGEEAIDRMQTFTPALIICDQIMPGINGIEVMQKAQELHPDTVRILMTGSHDLETAINAINLGQVNQYLTKPWQDSHLYKTIENSLYRYKLTKENQALQNQIFNQHKELKKNHHNLKLELQLGARIQEQLLIGKTPTEINNLNIYASSCPSKDIDGDFFEFYHPVAHILDMVIGDVMGKGIAAALLGTAVKTQMVRFAKPFPFSRLYELDTGWQDSILSPTEILNEVNQEVSNQLIDLEYFITLFYARFDFQYQLFSYVDCGSAKPMIYRAKEKKIERLSGDNFPLGVVKTQEFQLFKTSFSEGDIFVFYSDGVSEARAPDNTFFGEERITNIITQNPTVSAEALALLIRESAFKFMQKEKPDDDLTVVVIKILSQGNTDFSHFLKTQFHSDLSQLSAVRDFIKRLCCKAPGNCERLSNELQLVINEAFCNIVKHGHLDARKKTIHISGELSKEEIIIHLADQGLPYDPSVINEPSFSGNHDTGYGWHMMRQLSDKISYTRKSEPGGWNHLRIYKRYYFGEKKMNITYKTEGKILIITPEGESLDANDATEFKEKVIELINDSKLKGVIFNLGKLQFIDSSGLGAFLSVLRLLNSRGEDLKLSEMSKPVRTMFELVKMHKIFEIFNTTEDAVDSFKP